MVNVQNLRKKKHQYNQTVKYALRGTVVGNLVLTSGGPTFESTSSNRILRQTVCRIFQVGREKVVQSVTTDSDLSIS